MPRRAVECQPGELYHVYNRGVDRQPVFFDRNNYAHFLRLLRRELIGEDGTPAQQAEDTSRHRNADVICYCLMPNHFHLVLRPLTNDLSHRMGQLGKSYTQAINNRLARFGPLFQGRFKAIHVDQEEYLLHLTRYIHLNPVRAGLTHDPALWEFSSYQEFIGQRSGTIPSPHSILQNVGGADRYKSFVESGNPQPRALRKYLIQG